VIETLQGGLDKTIDSFTKTLKETSLENGRLSGENEQLKKLLGPGANPQDTDVREATNKNQPEENQSN